MFRKILALGFTSTLGTTLLLDDNVVPDTKRHAICILYPNESNARGIASFSQDSINSPTKIAFSVKGLNPNGKHGVHVH
jgi:hypothetical protein